MLVLQITMKRNVCGRLSSVLLTTLLSGLQTCGLWREAPNLYDWGRRVGTRTEIDMRRCCKNCAEIPGSLITAVSQGDHAATHILHKNHSDFVVWASQGWSKHGLTPANPFNQLGSKPKMRNLCQFPKSIKGPQRPPSLSLIPQIVSAFHYLVLYCHKFEYGCCRKGEFCLIGIRSWA